eukprot:SAG25_NODE_87_length_16363_cov_40.489179_14_plen_43_part_00
MQGTDRRYLKVSACLKHLIAYSTEEGPPTRSVCKQFGLTARH